MTEPRLTPVEIEGLNQLAMAMFDKRLAWCSMAEVAQIYKRLAVVQQKQAGDTVHLQQVFAEAKECGCPATAPRDGNGKLIAGQAFIAHRSSCSNGRINETERGAT